jgi:hypothetical protein
MTAVLKEDSAESQSVFKFETCPPPIILVEGHLVNLSDRLQLTVACVGNAGRSRLSSITRAVLKPISGLNRVGAYSPRLVVTNCPLDYKTFSLNFCLTLAGNFSMNCTSDDLIIGSPPVNIFNDSDCERGAGPVIRSNSTVALFLREPTPSPLVKYMCALDNRLYASTSRWSIFRITAVPETDGAISNGSTIILTDVYSGIKTEKYVLLKAKIRAGDEPVHELQSLAFRRPKEDGSSVYLAMSGDGDRSDFESPLCEEAPEPSNGGQKEGSLYTRACWTIVSISTFSHSFFDLLNRTPLFGLSSVLIPFPAILDSELDVSTNIISANIFHFFYIDRATSQWTSYEVWLGVAGRLHTTVTAIYGKKGGVSVTEHTSSDSLFLSPPPPVRASVGGRNDPPSNSQGYARGSSILRT